LLENIKFKKKKQLERELRRFVNGFMSYSSKKKVPAGRVILLTILKIKIELFKDFCYVATNESLRNHNKSSMHSFFIILLNVS